MEAYVCIGSAYTDAQKRTIEKECAAMVLSDETVRDIQSNVSLDSSSASSLLQHPLDSTMKIKTTPVFINVYPRTSIRQFRILCSTILESQSPLFLWYRNPAEQSKYQAQHFVEGYISGENFDRPRLAKDVRFPMDRASPQSSSDDRTTLIDAIAARQYTEVCLDSGRATSYFDIDALHYVYRNSVYDASESANTSNTKTLRQTTLYCANADAILGRATEPNKKTAVRQYLRVIEAMRGKEEPTEYDTSVYDTIAGSATRTQEYSVSMSECHLTSDIPIRRKPLQHMFNTMCLSPQIIASCFSNTAVNIRDFRFYKDPKRPSALTYSGKEKTMTDWITSMSKHRADTPIWLSFRVLLGQIGTMKTAQCTITHVGETLDIDVHIIQPDNTVETRSDTLPLSIAEDLLQWEAAQPSEQSFRDWLSTNQKDVQVLTYAKAMIYETRDTGNVSVEYVSGEKTGHFTHLHSSFVFPTGDADAIVVDNRSQYATITCSNSGQISVHYAGQHVDVTEHLSIPELSSVDRLRHICTSLFSRAPLSEEIVYDGSRFDIADITRQLCEQSSAFTFTQPILGDVSIDSCIQTLAGTSKTQTYVQVIPKVLYRRGDTIFYRKTSKSPNVHEGIVLGMNKVSYLIKAVDSGKEMVVSMDNVDYSWKHTSTMTVAPAYVLRSKDVAVQWILWCAVQKKSKSETVRTVTSFVGRLKNVDSLIQQTLQSYSDAKQAQDMGIVKLLFTPATSTVDVHIRHPNVTFNCTNITDDVERQQLLYTLSHIIHSSRSGADATDDKTRTGNAGVDRASSLSVRQMGLEFDLSDDSDSDDSDSDDNDHGDKEGGDNDRKKEVGDRAPYVPIAAHTLLERIQKLDSYFLSKAHFRQGYARSCQKSGGSQPLGMPAHEFERVREKIQSAYETMYPSKTFTVCSQNAPFNSKTDTCFAVEFRNNYFMCPNNQELLQAASSSGTLPAKIESEIESQFVHKNTFVGINSANAPCCFKKPNKNMISYINNTSRSSSKFIYSPYIKDWGHELPPLRFGFCPPTLYSQLNMKTCEQGNITNDSRHDCLLRLGVTQGPDALLSCGAYVYSVLNAKNARSRMMSVADFKETLSTIILKLDENSDRDVLAPFSINDFSEKQNYVEYIQSHAVKDVSVCLPLLHQALLRKCRIVVLAFENGSLTMKCTRGPSKGVSSDKICIFLETTHEGRSCIDVLVNVKSSSFKLNTLSSVQCTFSPEDIIQGQRLYDIIQQQEPSCDALVSALPVRDIHFMDMPSVHDIASIRGTDEESQPIQIQDIFGKVIAASVHHRGTWHTVPIQPSSIDARFEVKRLGDESIIPSTAVDAYACLQMVQGELNRTDILPTHTVGTKDAIHYLAFTSGQRVPVAETPVEDFQSSVSNIPHIRDVVYDDVHKALERAHQSYVDTNVQYAPVLDIKSVVDSLSTVGNVTPVSIYRMPGRKPDRKPDIPMGILTIESTDDRRQCGIHVSMPDELETMNISETKTCPTYAEVDCLDLLMTLWRKSKYTVPCRPYRYQMDGSGMYTHLVLENGKRLQLQTPVLCMERLDNRFRSVRLNHIEVVHHTSRFFDEQSHRDAYTTELQNNSDAVIEAEVETQKQQWTKEKQAQLFSIVNSSNIPYSVLADIQRMGISEGLALRLIHNPLHIQEWIDPELCPTNTHTMSSEEAVHWVIHTAIRARQKQYFTNVLDFDTSIQKRDLRTYEYALQPVANGLAEGWNKKRKSENDFSGKRMTYSFTRYASDPQSLAL
jgi:hypothetical protein